MQCREFESANVRGGIPILKQEVNGHQLTRQDNEAESKNPNQVFYYENQFIKKQIQIYIGAHKNLEEKQQICMRMRVTKFKNILMLHALRNYFFRDITEGASLFVNSYGRENIING